VIIDGVIIDDNDAIDRLLEATKRIAVLGIKTVEQADQAISPLKAACLASSWRWATMSCPCRSTTRRSRRSSVAACTGASLT